MRRQLGIEVGKNFLRVVVLSLVLPVSAGTSFAKESDAGASMASSGPGGFIEEIVVTARRREELLEDTPISLTAVGETELQEAGVTAIDQIEELVPNLVFTRSFTGTAAEISIRGVGTSAIDGIFDPGVGVYVDGVFLSRTGSQLFDIVDIQQIEVLRGPQGTLFGKNTIGGALNVTTIKPHADLEAFALVRPGNFGSLETRAMVNLPVLGDRLFARLSMGTRNTGGYTENILRDERYNDPNVLSFVGALRFLASEDLTVDLTGTWAKQDGRGPGGQCRVVREQGFGTLLPGYYDACRESRPYEFEADTHGIQSLETSGLWAVADWSIGGRGPFDDLGVKAIGAWRHQVTSNRIDLDMTGFPLASLSANGGGELEGDPFRLDMYQAEVQLNGQAWDQRIDFVAGAFGFWEEQRAVTVLQILPDILGSVISQQQNFDNWNWALFGQATVQPTDWLGLTAGLRYTEEKKGASTVASFGDPPLPATSVSNSRIFSAWTPTASLALNATPDMLDRMVVLDHLMGYFTYSRGFKGGGWNLAVGSPSDRLDPVAPETLDNFEIGFKSIGFDQRLTFNASFYLGNYEDIQVTTLQVVDIVDGVPNFQRITQNAAEATTRGFELEMLAMPFGGLQIRGSVGFTRAVYDEYDGSSQIDDAPIDRAGETFNGVPELQTHLSAQYAFPIDLPGPEWLSGWLTPRLDWYYQSEVHWSFPELVDGVQPGYNLVHARLSYDFNENQTQVALWGKNITGEEYFDAVLSIANVAGTLSRYYAPPAAFGAEISHRFQ